MKGWARGIAAIGACGALSAAAPVFSAKSTGGGVSLQSPLGSLTFFGVFSNLITAATLIATPVLAIMVVTGGFQIMAARDNKESAAKGRKTIYNAMIGFAVVLGGNGAVAIVRDLLKSP